MKRCIRSHLFQVLAGRKVEVQTQPAWVEGDHARVIRVTLSATADEVMVRIADEGAGIAPEHMGRIFDLFCQADGAGQGRAVALTGYGAEHNVRRALDAGFEVHLTKPVDPAELDSLLARAA
jgi:light-regulated signal transduction histidine kinase (bacteriophytochrome)